MKKILSIALVLLTTITAVYSQEWVSNFDEAKAIAAKGSKPIILVFQGSDWCAPCIKLNREVWSTNTFKEYSADNYVMLQVDFPRRKKNALSKAQTVANAKLAEAYNKNGVFPFVVVLDSYGKVLGETSYKKTTPQNYIDELNAFAK